MAGGSGFPQFKCICWMKRFKFMWFIQQINDIQKWVNIKIVNRTIIG